MCPPVARPLITAATLAVLCAGALALAMSGNAAAQVAQFGALDIQVTFPTNESVLVTLKVYNGAHGERGFAATKNTDKNGSATFTLAPGEYQLRGVKNGEFLVNDIIVRPGEVARVNLSYGAINATVANAEGTLGALVQIVDAQHRTIAHGTTVNGNATFILPPGNYSVRARVDNDVEVAGIRVDGGNITKVNASFALVRVFATAGHGFGESGLPVLLLHESERRKNAREGHTDADGAFTVNLAAGNYSVSVKQRSFGTITISPENVTTVRARFGILLAYAKDDSGNWTAGKVSVRETTGVRALFSLTLPPTGVGEILLQPGTYDVTFDAEGGKRVAYYGIPIEGGDVVRIGDYQNHDPVVSALIAAPARVGPGESLTLKVTTKDLDRDALTFNYAVTAGVILGNGSTITYRAGEDVSDTIVVEVRDDAGGFSSYLLYVADVKGRLNVTTLGVDGAPLADSRVTAVAMEGGRQRDVASGRTNEAGEASINVPIGVYDVRATQSNDVWIPHVLVPRNGASYVIGSSVNASPPAVISSMPPDSVVRTRLGGALNFSVNAVNADGSRPQYRWSLDQAYASSDANYTYRAGALSEGAHTIRVLVTNGAASAHREWTVHVSWENHAPRIIAVGAENLTVKAGTRVVLSVAAVDPDGDALTYKWRSGDTLENDTSANPVWIANLVKKTEDRQIEVEVSDGNMTAGARLTLTVTLGDAAPPATRAAPSRLDRDADTDMVDPAAGIPGPGAVLCAVVAVGVALATRRIRRRRE